MIAGVRQTIHAVRRLREPMGTALRRNRHFVVRGLLATVAIGLLEVLRPLPLKVVFDFVLLDKAGQGAWTSIATWMRSSPAPGTLAAAGALLLIAGLHAGAADTQHHRR